MSKDAERTILDILYFLSALWLLLTILGHYSFIVLAIPVFLVFCLSFPWILAIMGAYFIIFAEHFKTETRIVFIPFLLPILYAFVGVHL